MRWADLPPVDQSVIDGLIAGIPGVREAAGDARITTVFAPTELPSEVLEEAENQGIPQAEIHGVLYKGRVARAGLKEAVTESKKAQAERKKRGGEVKPGPAYLVKKKNAKVAHIWLGFDTACRMHSTGGLRQKRYMVAESSGGLPICTMCDNMTVLPESVDFRLAYLKRRGNDGYR